MLFFFFFNLFFNYYFIQKAAKSTAVVPAHFYGLQLQDLFILDRITIQMLFIFNATLLLLVMSTHSNYIRIDGKQMSELTIKKDYLQ